MLVCLEEAAGVTSLARALSTGPVLAGLGFGAASCAGMRLGKGIRACLGADGAGGTSAGDAERGALSARGVRAVGSFISVVMPDISCCPALGGKDASNVEVDNGCDAGMMAAADFCGGATTGAGLSARAGFAGITPMCSDCCFGSTCTFGVGLIGAAFSGALFGNNVDWGGTFSEVPLTGVGDEDFIRV